MANSNTRSHTGSAQPAHNGQFSAAQAMTLAAQLQSQGHLQEAERLLREILRQQPGHAFALHLLGVIAHQCGKQPLANGRLASH